MKLYYHSTSSASLRVLLFLKCRKVPDSKLKLVSTGIKFNLRGIPVWTIPEEDAGGIVQPIVVDKDQLKKYIE